MKIAQYPFRAVAKQALLFKKIILAVILILALLLPGRPAHAAEIDPLRDPLQLLDALEKRRLEQDKRAQDLTFREEELKRLEEKIDKRIATLEALRQELQQGISKEKEIDDANIVRLAKIFSVMPAKSAATRLQALDREVAIKVLKNIREKTAAKILSNIETKDAAELAKELGISIEEKRRNKP